MPEAFAVLFVFVVATSSYIAARMHAADPANANPAAEAKRLCTYCAWLRERLQQARRENWDSSMIARLEEENAIAEAQLAKIATAFRDAA